MTSAIWTPERTRQLTALWNEGCTAASIAGALGAGVSRCAVLGKLYRLGLARGAEARRARPAAPPRGKRRREKAVAARSALSSTVSIAAPSSPTATILSVKAGQCRWPCGSSGEADFGLCGRPVARGAFCAAHAAVGYRKRPRSAVSLPGSVRFD